MLAMRISSFLSLIATLLVSTSAAARSQDPTPFVWDIDVKDPATMDKKQVVDITRKDPDYKWFARDPDYRDSKVRHLGQ